MAISHFEHFTFLYKILTNILVLHFAAMPAGLPLSCGWCLQSADWGMGGEGGDLLVDFENIVYVDDIYQKSASSINVYYLNKILKRKHYLADKNVHTASNGLRN